MDDAAAKLGRAGGIARAALLSPERRSEIASKAAAARWGRTCMKSLGSPGYKYSPWTPERRKAASDAAKARWEARREKDRKEAEHYRETISAKLAGARYARVQQMNEIVRQYRVLEAEVKEIERAQTLANELTPILRRFSISGETA